MLQLLLKFNPACPVEIPGFTPDLLSELDCAEIANRTAKIGNELVRWGDLFQITGSASDREIAVQGDLSRFKMIGQGMISGRLTIDGCVCTHAGSAMRGGELVINGNAEDWLGAEMRGGVIRVSGSVGDNAGGAYRGSTKGMRGGMILVNQNAGSETAAYMRRGIIAVGGDCGSFAGAGMIAGSLVVRGSCGSQPGAGMKRGSVVSLSGKIVIPNSFGFDCVYSPPIWGMMINHLRKSGFEVAPGLEKRMVRRHRGDLVSLGLGEILLPADNL